MDEDEVYERAEVDQWPFIVDNGNDTDKYGQWKEENVTKYPGIWAGLDLGTTHSSIAVWDTKLHRPKLLRLDIAPRMGEKQGKFVPSSLLFLSEEDQQQRQLFPACNLVDVSNVIPSVNHKIKAMVGTDAYTFREQCYTKMYNQGSTNNKGLNKCVDPMAAMRLQSSSLVDGNAVEKEPDDSNTSHVEAAFVSSSKRMFGRSVSACSPDFISQLPFSTIADASNDKEVQIQIHPLSHNPLITPHDDSPRKHDYTPPNNLLCIKPSQISSILMSALREAAQRSLTDNHNILSPPGGARMEGSSSSLEKPLYLVRNVIIGVPAHYTLHQRRLVEHSAREAGFDGYVGTMTESTAAALAYGLFTSSSFTKHTTSSNDTTTTTTTSASSTISETELMVRSKMYGTKERRYSNVLVFDMGGGTTDVTIVQLIKNRNICSEEEDKILDNDNKNLGTDYREAKETFECRVIATSGDVALGGDDIDDLLTQWFLNHDDIPTDVSKTNQDVTMNPVEHRELRRICCMAKEDLCGDGKDQGPKNFVSMEYGTKRVTLSMEMFERIIEHIIQRAEDTINLALHSFLEHVQSKGNQEFSTDSKETMPGIDEVVLVGGGSRIPAIRKMLRKKFPPPNPPELCTALNACSLVAMGAATHAAMISRQVPLHEIISALTLDSLPHTIGILTVENDKNSSNICNLKQLHQVEHAFFPILLKDSPLPSSNYKTFELENPHQKGITVHVVEYVGGGVGLHEYEHVGVFTFLLHKLSSTDRHQALNANSKRTVDVAISVDSDGNLGVSIFDWNDPEHLMKLRRYLSKKHEDVVDIDDLVYQKLVENPKGEIPVEQMLLILGCCMLIVLYIFVKLLFSTEVTESHNEL